MAPNAELTTPWVVVSFLIRGVAIASVSLALAGLAMNFPWREHAGLGAGMAALSLAAVGLLVFVLLYFGESRWVSAGWLVLSFGVGVAGAFAMDSVSEQHIQLAEHTAEGMSRRLTGRVIETRGLDWLPAGTSCTVVVEGSPGLVKWTEIGWSQPSSDDPEHLGPCRVQVLCAEATLYGAGTAGYLRTCVLGDDASLEARDTEGVATDSDPVMSLSTTAGHLEVQDDSQGGAAPYAVVIALEQSP
ncbi:MAG TPA: hypothetical protein QGF58_03235 [Myxococcota bacterium]|nr:hypothetical protein [Myxococcota bacterium]